MEYKLKPIKSLKSNFSQRKGKGLNSFDSFEDFHNWYNKQNKVCYYCGLREEETDKNSTPDYLLSDNINGRACAYYANRLV
jgi:hypothetical protein